MELLKIVSAIMVLTYHIINTLGVYILLAMNSPEGYLWYRSDKGKRLDIWRSSFTQNISVDYNIICFHRLY